LCEWGWRKGKNIETVLLGQTWFFKKLSCVEMGPGSVAFFLFLGGVENFEVGELGEGLVEFGLVEGEFVEELGLAAGG
jgi:hypothetical protein